MPLLLIISRKDLVRSHRTPLCPCRDKGALAEMVAYSRHGLLIVCCLRPTFAIRKAYASAMRGMDTSAFAEQLRTQGRSLESFGDPQLIALPGGVIVTHDGAVVGAVGVVYPAV